MQSSGKETGRTANTAVEPPEANDMNHEMMELAPDVKLNPRAQSLIGQRLKMVYNELVQEPVPEHLLELLEELERKEGKE